MAIKKGQAAIYGLMVAVIIFLAAMAFIPAFQDTIDTARTDLDCTNASISTGEKGTCLIVDLTMPYFIGAVLIAGFGYIFVRKVLG